MNLNQLDRIIDHFMATYDSPPVEVYANEKTGLDLLSQVSPPRDVVLIDDLFGQPKVYYRNVMVRRNDELLDCELELVGLERAAKYFADDYDDGPITKVENGR